VNSWWKSSQNRSSKQNIANQAHHYEESHQATVVFLKPEFLNPMPSISSPSLRPRLNSIDLLRGLVLVLMVLDHTRDFLHASPQDPSATLDPYVFFTRWITHFCAPVFMLLTGTAAYLYGAKGKTSAEVSGFLFTRGLWLIFAEMVIVRFAWTFTLDVDFFFLQVIFAIGVSMVALSAMVYLPQWAIAVISFALIFGHNAFDGIHAASLGDFGVLWNFLHEPARLRLSSGLEVYVLYPVVPWIGVVAAGYVMGSLYKKPQELRAQYLATIGLVLVLGFFALRCINIYGNPVNWEMKASALETLVSFLNVEKYPPSLLFLMMTLGPSLLFLAFAENAKGVVVDFFVVFGRVPFFFYVTHLGLVHVLAVIYAFYTGIGTDWVFGKLTEEKPGNYGLSLSSLYLIWPVVILALYPLCKWFGALKQRRHDWWLSYV